jgi:hypothetical protein
MKIIAGSILAGFGLLTEVVNEWFSHYFFAVLNMAKGMMLEGGGSFRMPPAYTNPGLAFSGIDGYGIDIFIITRVLIWIVFALGITLIIWGIRERPQQAQ